ncbi:AHI1 protein, partial [Polypterus senegalus]
MHRINSQIPQSVIGYTEQLKRISLRAKLCQDHIFLAILVSELHTQNYSCPSSDASPAIASLADVLWVATDESENFVRFRNEFRPRGTAQRSTTTSAPSAKVVVSTQSLRATQEKGNLGKPLPASTNTLKKITVLEDELSRLRAQIAMIVHSQNQGSLQSPSTPEPSPNVLVLTSTPVSHCAAPPLAPPLPPTSISKQSHSSTVDLIRERRAIKKSTRTARESPVAPGLPAMPSMLDVLKDINKVQLRAVERSPGGTPVMRKDRKRVSLSDPAALIADALKRKFAHRQKEDSFDKENRSFDTSPFGSPETPKLDALKKSLDLQKKTEDDETILNNTYNSEEQSPRFTKNKLRDLKTASTEKIINSFYNEEEPKHVKPKKKKKKEAVEDPRQNEGNYDGLGISVRNEDSQLPKAVTNNPILESDDIIKNSSKRTRKVPRLPEERELTTNMQEYDIQVQQTNEDAIRMKLKKKIAEKMMESMEAINQEVVLNNETEQKKKKKKKERIITIPKDETSVLSAPEQQDDPIEGTSKKKNKEEIVIAKNSDDAWPRKEEKEEIIEEQPLPMPKGKKKKKKKKDESLVEERPAEDIISAEPESETFQNEVKHSFDESLVLGVYIHRTDRLKTDMMVSHPMVKVYVVDETTGEYLRKENSCRPVSSFYEQEKVEHILPIMTQPYDFKKYKSTVPEWEEQIVFNERFGYFLQENEQSPKVILFFEVLDFMSMDEARANFELQTKHERGFRKIAWAFLKLVGTNNVLNVDNKVRLQLYYPHIKSRTKPNIIEIYEGWKKFPRNRYPSTLYVTIKGLKLPEKVDPSVRSMMALQQERGTTSYTYEIPSGKVLGAFNGHLNIVYDLSWSKDDKSLISASSDGTVRVWNMETFQGLVDKVLPHPSFVYASQFHPAAQYLVVTGGYDCVIRIWNVKVKNANGQLLQEFDGHKSFINTLCFSKDGINMFSGDSSGLIIVWNTFADENFHLRQIQQWGIEKEIQENDLKGVPINHLEVHPNGRRLLIHAKDSTLRIMDLRILAAKKYTGATNYREKIHSNLTPCGSFLFSGSEDGMAYVWNAETGDQVAVYSELCYSSPLRDVAFHPHENMVAFCAFGSHHPVYVYLYDRKVAQMEAEAVKDVEGHLIATVPKGPRFLCNVSDVATLQDSTLASMDGFARSARKSMRKQQVMQLLDSVLVVALYDYTANRSDELTIRRGDIIQVLYKDNDNWWFGHLANGQQGYFPANYVADETGYEEDLSRTLEPNSETSNQQEEAEQRTPTPTKMTAVISRRGELKLISEHETDSESPAYQVHKKKKKKTTSGRKLDAAIPQYSSESAAVEQEQQQQFSETVRKRRPKSHVKHSDGSGNVNDGFQVD